MKKKVVGLGEVLWDILPERTCLGGAPANFAYITTLMGDRGIVASRVGEDSRGLESLRRMEELGLDIDHVQTDSKRPTGTVKVELDATGQAKFDIAHPVAWASLLQLRGASGVNPYTSQSTPSSEVTGSSCRVPKRGFSLAPEDFLLAYLCRFAVRVPQRLLRGFSRQCGVCDFTSLAALAMTPQGI